jgi:hypothetical protein
MDDAPGYEAYPISLVILCNLVPLAIYALGGYILAGLGAGVLVVYVLYCLWVEAKVLRDSCTDCYYYGKWCGLGKGRLCALLFPRGSPQRFAERQISWKDLLPDLMVFVAPLVGGIARLVTHFAWPVLLALVALVALNFAGNAATRGAIMCRFCRQRAIGCPAQNLFAGKSAQ